MLIKNESLKNEKISTISGTFQFDEKGIADIPDNVAKLLLTLEGFSAVNAKTGATRQAVTSEKTSEKATEKKDS